MSMSKDGERKLTWQTADPDDCYGVAPAAITDTQRLDWLGEHAMRIRPEDAADVRIEHAEGEGFRVREWGAVEYDDEGEPDWRRRFYRSTLYPSLREAIDAAIRASQDR